MEWFWFWLLKLAQIGVGLLRLWVAVCRRGWVVLLTVGGLFACLAFCGPCGFLWILILDFSLVFQWWVWFCVLMEFERWWCCLVFLGGWFGGAGV